MTIDETLQYIHTINWRGSKLGLERISELLRLMGEPQNALRFVHVAGTNGKGSVCAMLASILQSAGYKTGLYISPYISRFNERMRINGEAISDKELCDITEYVKGFAESMADLPTEFEIVCAVAFEFFKRNGCDAVVLETGLGGRLDATNVIAPPLASVITAVDFDHMKELGDTLELIAAEKCGIIKSPSPVVSYEQRPEAGAVIEATCRERGCELTFADFSRITSLSDSLDGQTFSYKASGELFLPLLGAHQLKNAALAIETVYALRREGFVISDEALKNGLAATRWEARFELLAGKPIFVLDGAHNPHGARACVDAAKKYLKDRKLTLLVGVLRDKDYARVLDIADELGASWYVCVAPDSPRALSAVELAETIRKRGKNAVAADGIKQGIDLAMLKAGEDGAVLAFGSLYMAGQIREAVLEKRGEDEL